MRRRDVLGLIALAPMVARGQPRKVYRIGVLETAPPALNAENFDRFRKGLEERGYIEGPTLVMLYRNAEGQTERFEALAAELVKHKVDLILTRGTPATMAARRATSTIPIVTAAVAEQVPAANITGLTSATAEMAGKRLELLKALVPNMVRVAAYANLDNVAALATWKETEAAARTMKLEPMLLDVRSLEQIEPAFAEAARRQAQGLVVGIETLTQSNRKTIIGLAAKHKLPAIYSSRDFVADGGLVSYGVNYGELYYRAADYADRIFKGAAPAELPIGRPEKFSMFINRRTARDLGVVVPPDILLRADRTLD